MFGIPGKQAVTITPRAAVQIAKLMGRDGQQGLRIGVKKGGCGESIKFDEKLTQ